MEKENEWTKNVRYDYDKSLAYQNAVITNICNGMRVCVRMRERASMWQCESLSLYAVVYMVNEKRLAKHITIIDGNEVI